MGNGCEISIKHEQLDFQGTYQTLPIPEAPSLIFPVAVGQLIWGILNQVQIPSRIFNATYKLEKDVDPPELLTVWL